MQPQEGKRKKRREMKVYALRVYRLNLITVLFTCLTLSSSLAEAEELSIITIIIKVCESSRAATLKHFLLMDWME